ncbi:fimbria/pilus periplasmic chaperone [Zobellella sp. DQSA1]|uniref:fimbria/pilus periplasmic chaperone n=1 Tax=Zobellella sp. DQSA1 TaxID=3342386 RepID=UPI0035C13537
MKKPRLSLTAGTLLLSLVAQQAGAAIALDRTRVVFDGGANSASLNVSNENKQLPYLAQGWIEDEAGEKISSPLTVLPPLQRIEPGEKSQVKIQALPEAARLPQDRESLFYFNLREIPPKSDKPNTLQIALQTRIKLFYRPKGLMTAPTDTPWQEQLTLSRQGNQYRVHNPTPYYVTLVEARRSPEGEAVPGFEPLMLAPHGEAAVKIGSNALGDSPVLTYVNDYGGRPQLQFSCAAGSCQASPVER